MQNGDPTNGMLPLFILPARDILVGIGLIVLIGLLAGVVPAMGAMRMRITDALRRN